MTSSVWITGPIGITDKRISMFRIGNNHRLKHLLASVCTPMQIPSSSKLGLLRRIGNILNRDFRFIFEYSRVAI